MSDIMTAIYGGGPFYYGGEPVFADLQASGFTTVIMGIHLGSSGDIQIDIPLVQNGQYVGNPDWPAQLASLKQAGSSVNRLLFCMGGWGVGDFPNIQALIASQGTGPSSILYRNFLALKEAIPTLDGIDLDDETLYDPSTTVAFSRMLNALGYQVTFCPYMNQQFWVDCFATLNNVTPNLVTGFNLQCYAGGGSNAPQPWIDAIAAAMPGGFPAASYVFPGLWCRNEDGSDPGLCPYGVASQFSAWQSTGIQGGFIWEYDDIEKWGNKGLCGTEVPMTAATYASAVQQGLGQPPARTGRPDRRRQGIAGEGAKHLPAR